MTPEKIVENHKKYVLQSWSKQGNLNPIPVAKADGIYFYDFDGNRYTDMSSQLVNLNLGYENKATDYAIIGVKADMADHISSRKLESAFERTIYSYKKHWGGFKVDNMMFYVLNDFSDDEIESIAEKIQSEKERYISVNKLYVAVSKTNNKLKSLPKTYQIVLRMLRLAVRANMTPMFYDRFEVKKLILAVDDISLLESIYNENLKKLEVYDRDNGTDYMSFLRLYLKYDGSVQRVAQETFVHRNTINYQLAKIKKILGNSLKTFEERFKIILAFEVRDVL
ncbi:aminotransferase class III-fold pyridoxal phosphate-dependent enzyme [Ruminococcus bromii]|nr:aminotransferase class III-fold pyridoxal phosphate-dependent enzyme [Ruminococcus bromii]